jgi:hypothetical protein
MEFVLGVFKPTVRLTICQWSNALVGTTNSVP